MANEQRVYEVRFFQTRDGAEEPMFHYIAKCSCPMQALQTVMESKKLLCWTGALSIVEIRDKTE